MLRNVKKTCLRVGDYNQLRKVVPKDTDVFGVTFLGGTPARIPPRQSYLTTQASTVKVTLRNYSQEQRLFVGTMAT